MLWGTFTDFFSKLWSGQTVILNPGICALPGPKVPITAHNSFLILGQG